MAVSPIRFSGMASGLDTDTLIKDLMKSERVPLDKLTKQKQSAMWKRDEYRSFNTTFSAFQSLTDKLRFSSTFNKQAVTSSNSNVVDAKASASATSGTFSVKVNQLATSTVNVGEIFTQPVDVKADGLQAGTFKITGANNQEITVTVDATTTRQSIMKQINASGIGVSMSFDSINGRFIMSSTKTGANSTFTIEDSSGVFNSIFNMDVNKTTSGENASVIFNGVSMEMENNSFEFSGINFQLRGVSTDVVTVSASRDTKSITDNITQFVNDYNALVDLIRGKVKETPDRNYAPLTDDEKEAMTEKQIELWESKAKVGLLYRDDLLDGALNSFKSLLSKKVEGVSGAFDSLDDIGITFKGFQNGLVSDLGKIELDVNKLNEAIEKNPDAVAELFGKTSSKNYDDPTRVNDSGIAERLYNELTNQMNKIKKRIGSGTISDAEDNSQYGKLIGDLNDKIDNVKRRMEIVENRYYKQFTTMEVALQKLNSQGSWLTSQLGQM